MKLPILKQEYCTAGWIAAIAIAALCLLQRFFALPGYEYSTGIFLSVVTVILALFSGETSKSAQQVTILVFVVGTCILLMARRFPVLMDGIEFGPSLFPVNDQLGLACGLLWLLPVWTSIRLSTRFAENIYLRSFYGALLVLAPSVFMLMSSSNQFLIYWEEWTVSPKAIAIWFVLGFFFHFAVNALNVKGENPIATRLYFVYLGYFIATVIFKMICPIGFCATQ